LKIDEAHARADEVQKQTIARTNKIRGGLIAELGKHVALLHEAIMNLIKEWNARVEDKESTLKREAAAVGINL
jgi:hypothetical protein